MIDITVLQKPNYIHFGEDHQKDLPIFLGGLVNMTVSTPPYLSSFIFIKIFYSFASFLELFLKFYIDHCALG